MRTLVVILNKDNAEGLKRTLDSLTRQTVPICREFDVLVMDGGSKDHSEEVTLSFSKNYPCIKFRIQRTLGGTGYARLEASLYALENGYDIIIWGDSENIYSSKYIEGFLKRFSDGCDVVGGIPIVIGGFWSHAYAWYHSIHLVFPWIKNLHIPGNNRGEKTRIYHKVLYPVSKRAEDYGYSLLLLKKGIKLRNCISSESKVYVSLPSKFREVLKWQNYRSMGVAEVCRDIDVFPFDCILWTIFLATIVLGLLLIPFYWEIGLVILSLPVLFSLVVSVISRRYILEPKIRYILAPFIGLLIHSYYCLKTIVVFPFIRRKILLLRQN